jgi:2-octaprenyl-6-methoxyphenol hydroxylase
MKQTFDCDVIVLGGGLAGQTLALALDQAGLSVALVDAAPLDDMLAPEFDGRASALAYTSFRMLEAIGAADRMREHVQRIEHILVCDGRPYGGARPGGPGAHTLHFDRREIHPEDEGEPLGYMAENRHTRHALTHCLRESGVTLHAPARADRWEHVPGGIELHLEDGRVLSARLLCACDGKFSRARQQAGTRTAGWTYNQSGIVMTVEHEEPHEGVAYEYFMPGGPFAILPLPGNRSSLVWTEKTDIATAILGLDEAGLQAELEKRFGDFLGAVKPVGPKFSYPLSVRLAENFFEDRIAYVGDAARGIHPLAGQGFNLGIRDAAALAEVLVEAKSLGLELGSAVTLQRYAKWRKLDSMGLVAATDVFNRLFSNDIGPLRWARGLGLSLVDRIPPARKFFMREAGGETGDLPKLLKGESLAA